jgi:hypothetical protein
MKKKTSKKKTSKGKPLNNGSGKGKRANKGRGGCKTPQGKGRGK